MKKMFNDLKDKNAVIVVLVVFAFYGGFIIEHFALDSYQINLSLVNNARHYLTAGRGVMSIYLLAMRLLSISPVLVKTISFFIAIVSLSLSVLLVKRLLDNHSKERVVNLISAISLILGVFTLELFIFSEYTGVMTIGILLSVVATLLLERYFQTNLKKYILLSLLSMILATQSYQGVVAYFICLGTILIVKYTKSIKDFIVKNIIVASIYGISALITLLTVKLMGSARIMTEKQSIVSVASKVLKETIRLLRSTSNFLPKDIFIIILLLVVIVILVSMIMLKKCYVKAIGLIYVLIASVFASLAPQSLLAENQIWIAARTVVLIGALAGVCLVYIQFNAIKLPWFSKVISVILVVVLLCLQWLGVQKIRTDHYTSNYLNVIENEFVLNEIKAYEEETNLKVQSIAYINDKTTSYSHLNVDSIYDINVRQYAVGWAAKDMLNVYLGRKLDSPEFYDEEVVSYCMDNDWYQMSEELLIFKGHVLYVCIY